MRVAISSREDSRAYTTMGLLFRSLHRIVCPKSSTHASGNPVAHGLGPGVHKWKAGACISSALYPFFFPKPVRHFQD